MAFNDHMTGGDSALASRDQERRASFTSKFQEKEEKMEVLVGKLIAFDKATPEGLFTIRLQIDPKVTAPPKIGGKPLLGKIFVVTGKSKALTTDPHSRLGQSLECFGTWDISNDGTARFVSGMVNEKMPDSPEAIKAFLGSGRVKGLGEAWANKLVDKYGVAILKILDENPDSLLDESGFGEKRLADVKASWSTIGPSRAIISFAQLHGLGLSVADKMFATFGESARRRAEQNPYCLIQIPGVGFKTADKLARSLGVAPKAPFRLQSCIKHVLDEAAKGEGHLALTREEIVRRVCDWLDLEDRLAVSDQVSAAVASGGLVERLLTVKVLRGDKWREEVVEEKINCYSTVPSVAAEKEFASDIARLMNSVSGKMAERRSKLESCFAKVEAGLDESQKIAARNALFSRFSVMTGGPGTGKTHTIRTILRSAEAAGLTVRMCAPTGRASKRMEEATGSDSATIHRILGFGDGGFQFNREEKLEGDLFIVDESSMVDIWLARAFLRAIPEGASVLIVGDADQLPSVGAGNVLADLITSGVIPTARLKSIHRQDEGSAIVENAHRIINNQTPDLSKGPEDSDFGYIEAKGNEEIQQKVCETVQALLGKGYSENSIQVLTPKNDGDLGIEGLNSILRPLMNPSHIGSSDGWRICQGDRVMQQKNNYQTDLFNGDIGEVVELAKNGKSALVDFEGRSIWLTGAGLKELKPAFAITIHKSQGTEHDVVIIPMTRAHSFMFSANLLYTAITRAKKKVILIGEKQVIYDVARKAAKQFRNTGLKEELISFLAPAMRKTISNDPF